MWTIDDGFTLNDLTMETQVVTFLAISPSVLTGDELRPDLLITLENKCIYTLEFTVGFESNLTNATRKRQKYQDIINEQLKKL